MNKRGKQGAKRRGLANIDTNNGHIHSWQAAENEPIMSGRLMSVSMVCVDGVCRLCVQMGPGRPLENAAREKTLWGASELLSFYLLLSSSSRVFVCE